MAESLETSEDPQRGNFSIVFRGYDRDEVDAYISELEQLLKTGPAGKVPTTQAEFAELLGAEVGALLAAAEDAAALVRDRAEEAERASAREVEKVVKQASAESAKLLAEAEQDAKRSLREAELKSTRLENAAKQRHDEMIEQAQDRIRMLRERERELLNRIDALEKAFVSMRHAADDIYKHKAQVQAVEGDQASVVELADSEKPGKS